MPTLSRLTVYWPLLVAQMLLFAHQQAAATEVHVCDCAAGAVAACIAGNDAQSGTAAQPWRSYERARLAFASIAGGDAVLFCRGGAWEINGAGERWVNGACQANLPCRVGAYLPAGVAAPAPAPLLRRVDGEDAFSLADGGSAENEAGYRIEDLHLLATTGLGNGIFLQNDIDDVVLSNLLIDGFRIGVYLAGSNACSADPACDGRNERITLEHSEISNNRFSGWLGGSNGSAILNSLFVGNGSEPVFDHNIYLSNSAGATVSAMRVIGNHLYRSALDDSGVCRAVSLVVHGAYDDLLIENNEVWEDVGLAGSGCWGIAVDPGYGSEPEAFSHVVIRGNVVRNVGNQAIGVAACSQCTIENNVIIQTQPASAFQSIGIAAPNRQRQANDQMLNQISVRNNSIWFGPGSAGSGIRLGGEGSSHLLASNVIHYAGTADFDCFELESSAQPYLDSDYNQCYSPNASNSRWVEAVGTLAQWQVLTALDAHSDRLEPSFADPNGGDLRALSPTSAMVDNGHPLHSSLNDILGRARDANPDRGAYEWVDDALFSDGFEPQQQR